MKIFYKMRFTIFFLVLLLVLNWSLPGGSVFAEGIGGYLEFNYSNSAINTEDETGETSKTKSDSFNQLYNLSLKKTLFPNVFLNAGGIFKKNSTSSGTDGENTEGSTIRINPFIDLTLKTPVFMLGGKYNIREEKTKGSDLLSVTNVNENYNAIFGWKPEGLPSVDLRFERVNLFDRDRLNQDTTNDFFSLALQYTPGYGYLKGLEIRYQPSYREIQNSLDDIVTVNLVHNARVTFSDTFFNRRVSLFTSYNLAYTETEITTSDKTIEVSAQLFPFSGLSAIDDTPADNALNLNSSLIDGDLSAATGVNLGLPLPGGDKNPRNIGIDFVVDTEVNNIFVWVDRELPDKIARSFKWDIYSSPDNQNWTFLTTIFLAPFGPFQRNFDINFSNVKTRYIKVVTNPLELGDTLGVQGDFSNIFVTEIQAFLKKPADSLNRRFKDTGTNQIYNLDVRTKILNVPSLFYEFSYYLTKSASSFADSTISNGLSANHTFSSVVSAQARVAREDSVRQDEKGVNYLYNASVTARPLNTLSHTLNYSGQTQEISGEKSNTNSVFINNSAELYKGINVNINGGVSFQTKDPGEKTTDTIFSFGSGLVPHRRVTVDLYYTSTDTKKSGDSLQDSSDFTRRGTLGVSYKPFDTVYLFTSLETITTTDKKRTLQNYGGNWSPFPDGSLQFTFTFNESLTSDEGKIRLIVPGVRWNISSRTFLDLSTQFFKSEAVSQRADSVTSSATLRTVF